MRRLIDIDAEIAALVPMPELEIRYNQHMAQLARLCRTLGYPPNLWNQSCGFYGGARPAAVALVCKPGVQSGLWELVRLDRIYWSVEWSMWVPEWKPLFTDLHRDLALLNLQEVGWTGDPEEIS
jgi:hypothetical protein